LKNADKRPVTVAVAGRPPIAVTYTRGVEFSAILDSALASVTYMFRSTQLKPKEAVLMF
jgi:hypothetical protein